MAERMDILIEDADRDRVVCDGFVIDRNAVVFADPWTIVLKGGVVIDRPGQLMPDGKGTFQKVVDTFRYVPIGRGSETNLDDAG